MWIYLIGCSSLFLLNLGKNAYLHDQTNPDWVPTWPYWTWDYSHHPVHLPTRGFREPVHIKTKEKPLKLRHLCCRWKSSELSSMRRRSVQNHQNVMTQTTPIVTASNFCRLTDWFRITWYTWKKNVQTDMTRQHIQQIENDNKAKLLTKEDANQIGYMYIHLHTTKHIQTEPAFIPDYQISQCWNLYLISLCTRCVTLTASAYQKSKNILCVWWSLDCHRPIEWPCVGRIPE